MRRSAISRLIFSSLFCVIGMSASSYLCGCADQTIKNDAIDLFHSSISSSAPVMLNDEHIRMLRVRDATKSTSSVLVQSETENQTIVDLQSTRHATDQSSIQIQEITCEVVGTTLPSELPLIGLWVDGHEHANIRLVGTDFVSAKISGLAKGEEHEFPGFRASIPLRANAKGAFIATCRLRSPVPVHVVLRLRGRETDDTQGVTAGSTYLFDSDRIPMAMATDPRTAGYSVIPAGHPLTTSLMFEPTSSSSPLQLHQLLIATRPIGLINPTRQTPVSRVVFVVEPE